MSIDYAKIEKDFMGKPRKNSRRTNRAGLLALARCIALSDKALKSKKNHEIAKIINKAFDFVAIEVTNNYRVRYSNEFIAKYEKAEKQPMSKHSWDLLSKCKIVYMSLFCKPPRVTIVANGSKGTVEIPEALAAYIRDNYQDLQQWNR
ncbi:MAG: hypothetical protein GY757_10125 [bacterium]|nr:hypothetical protein [bacterium]